MIKKRMSSTGLIVYDSETGTTVRFNRDETNLLMDGPVDFDALDLHCEVAHLEISSRCNLNCDYCYNPKDGKELTTKQWKSIVRDLTDNGVHQVTFGGGEPLMREDVIELAEFCEGADLPVCMTTNGLLIGRFEERLRIFRRVNVSVHERSLDNLEGSLTYLKDWGVERGINFVVSKRYLGHYDELVDLARRYDALLLFLSYKPVKGDMNQQVSPREVLKMARNAHAQGCRVAVDGYTSSRCLMKVRFVDISSEGDVYPCSFVRRPIGNLLRTPFSEVWRGRGSQEPCPYRLMV